jgi:hypothetical protein
MLVLHQRGPETGETMSGRRPTARLIATPEIATAIDRALIELMAATGERVSKTDFTDAVIRAGLSDLEKVKAFLRKHPEGKEGSDG